MTVVLLTGNYPFIDAENNLYSEKFARECDLSVLEESREWSDVGSRPKEFVKRLLVRDEQRRMTAKEALSHVWFTNDSQKTEFEELYHRAIRYWRPRMPNAPAIEIVEADNLKRWTYLQDSSPNAKISRRKGPIPMDPPYKPFPRRLNQVFYPKGSTLPFRKMSDKVKNAIEHSWTSNKTEERSSDAEDDLLSPRVLKSHAEPEKEFCRTPEFDLPMAMSASDIQVNGLLIQPVRKPRFQKLRQRESSRPSTENQEEGLEASERDISESHQTPAKNNGQSVPQSWKIFSPGAWDDVSRPQWTVSNGCSQYKLPSRPPTPKLVETSLQDVKNSTGPLFSPLRLESSEDNCRLGLGSFDSGEEERILCDGNPAPAGEENRISARTQADTTDQEANVPVASKNTGFESLHIHVPASAKSHTGSEVLATSTDALEGTFDPTNAYCILKSSHVASSVSKLKSPARILSIMHKSPISNNKRRRRSSIFDFEEDNYEDLSAQSKKKRMEQEPNRVYNIETFNSENSPPPPRGSLSPQRTLQVEITDCRGRPSLSATNKECDALYLPRI